MRGWAFLLVAAILGTSLAAAPQPAAAQQRQGARDTSEQPSGPSTAQVGAGTDNATTTGFSGSRGPPKGEPPLPQASLCDPYQGAVRQSCLATVLRSSGG
jgi:hypothetical protein